MVVTKSDRPDWFTWRDPPLEWCQSSALIPGFRFGPSRPGILVDFHVSHLACVPEEVEAQVNQLSQREYRQVDISRLRSYQTADLGFLNTRRGALLAYEMRLGKTPLATHLHDPATGILLVVGPLAAREAWRLWAEEILHAPVFCLSGVKDVDPEPGYPAYFIHYDVLHAHTDFLSTQKIGTLVLDECHALQAKRTHRLSAVSVVAPRAHKILGLSGTPMWNKPISLYSILHTLMPGAWGTRFTFAQRYCDAHAGAHGWIYDGASNMEELNARLAYIMVRRTWAEVASELPPTTRIIEPVELSNTQYTSIEAAATRVILAHKGPATVAGYLATLRRKLAEVKIEPAVEMAQRAAADGHKVVLWTWHNEVADKVVSLLEGRVFRIRSQDAPRMRDQEVQAFREIPGPAFMVAGMGVGGTAIDLSCSDYAIFVELDWTPANVSQAEMRTFHMSRPHVVVYLYTDNPVESNLIKALDLKDGFAKSLSMSAGDIANMVFA